MFEDAEDGVEEFAHEGDEGLQFGFTAGQEALIKGGGVRVVLRSDQGGHVEGATQQR